MLLDFDKVERGLAMVAVFVLRDGHRYDYAPLLEALEAEAARLRPHRPAERAQRILDQYRREAVAPRALSARSTLAAPTRSG